MINIMNNRFNDDAKEQVRSRTDIAAVIGRYVNLKGRGHTMMGLCPFHKEKTPSFTVNPLRGFYHCFGCGKGGDVFNFVMEMEGVDFREALTMLAGEAGVKLEGGGGGGRDSRYDGSWYGDAQYGDSGEPERGPPPGSSKATKTELLAIHGEAARFFYECMKKHGPAKDYFKSRGLLGQTVKDFCLGYAPDGWSGLHDCLRGKNIPLQRMIECGLVVGKESGAAYDRFRNRIIFPLFDLSGRIIAFAGRGFDADAQPKYLNSPETALYRKSGVLYGMHMARQAVRELGYLLIVEGYMDYLTLWQAGIRNAAAVSGTAFTEEHANIIKRFTQRVVLVFDGDRAGLSAAQRAAFVLAPFRLEVQILTLPGGDDPDSFVKRSGPEAFLSLLSTAQPAADFLIDKLISEHDGSSLGKSRIVDELAPYALAVSDEIVRNDFLKKVEQRLRLDRHLVADRYNKLASRPSAHAEGEAVGGAEKQAVLGALEESFFRILLTDPNLIVQARQYLSPEKFIDAPSANIYSIILEAFDQSSDLGGLHDLCSGDPEAMRLISMLAVKPALAENIRDELVQKILLLERKFLKARIAGLREDLRDCPESGRGRLLEELKDYGGRLRELG